ncbi:MAG: GT-D fold domain-containing glycosyltransferase [Aminipila sp.]
MAYYKSYLQIDEIVEQIKSCLKNEKPYSLVRLGHGEMHVVSYKICPDHNINRYFDHYHQYAGITGLNDKIASDLINALKKADLVGLGNHTPYNEELLTKIIQYYDLEFPSVCNAWICVEMINSSEFFNILRSYRVLIVGRRAAEGACKLRDLGVNITGTIGHEGFEAMPETINKISLIGNFDIALVSAGVPATIMCPEIAEKTGKVIIDFGHALDILIEGENFDHEKQVNDFNYKLNKGVRKNG